MKFRRDKELEMIRRKFGSKQDLKRKKSAVTSTCIQGWSWRRWPVLAVSLGEVGVAKD